MVWALREYKKGQKSSVTYLPLVIWNKYWELDGSRVRCRCCSRFKELADNRNFSHALGCEAWGLQAQYPGRELAPS
jgi:hypothetical protein